jgi:2-phosphoglycerate kinase
MPETLVVSRGGGLPYSKGLMAQSLSASGISPESAYELARLIEKRLDELGAATIETGELHELAAETLLTHQGDQAVRRFRDWSRVDRLDRPLVVLLGGTAGVGKSTVASMLANRLGITRVIATDAIRHVLRASFSRELMPWVHYSSFEAASAVPRGAHHMPDPDLAGFARQVELVGTGIEAIVERACIERSSTILEGVHAVPGSLRPDLHSRCTPVPALLVVEDEVAHRGHFALRGGERPAERYLASFDRIRKLQGHLVAAAEAAGVPVVENGSVDGAVTQLMELVLDAAATVGSVR